MRRFVATVIFLLVLCLALCGCGISSLQDVPLQNQPHVTYKIYVSGAVERDGYYEVAAGTSYGRLFQLAGILPQTVLPEFYTNAIDGRLTEIILDYYDGVVCDSINANNPYIASRIPVNGLSQDIVNKLADYIDAHGKFTNKQQLKVALGSDHEDFLYRFFISEEDYETVD